MNVNSVLIRIFLALSGVVLSGGCAVGFVGQVDDADPEQGATIATAATDEQCTSDERACDGDSVITCREDRTGWDLAEPCTYGCSAGACIACVPDCTGSVCGDDGCGGTCGTCGGAQDLCVEGACVCQPDCQGKTCGSDGCGGECGQCGAQAWCSPDQTCSACQSAVCGACDEIDTSTVVHFMGPTGEQNDGIQMLGPHVFDWPITTELVLDNVTVNTYWGYNHLPGGFWSTTSNGYTNGAAIVSCWDSITYGGVTCLTWEWMALDLNPYRSFSWPANRPVAHFLISATDQKRTAIRYFASWPHTAESGGYTQATVGTNLQPVACH